MTFQRTERAENRGLRRAGWGALAFALFPLAVAIVGWRQGSLRQFAAGLVVLIVSVTAGLVNLFAARSLRSPERLLDPSIRQTLVDLRASNHVVARVRLRDGRIYDRVGIGFGRVNRVGWHFKKLPFDPLQIADILSVVDQEK